MNRARKPFSQDQLQNSSGARIDAVSPMESNQSLQPAMDLNGSVQKAVPGTTLAPLRLESGKFKLRAAQLLFKVSQALEVGRDSQARQELSFLYCAQVSGFALQEKIAGESPRDLDAVVVQDRHGRRFLSILRWDKPDKFVQVGSAVLTDGNFQFSLAGGSRKYAIAVDTELPEYQQFQVSPPPGQVVFKPKPFLIAPHERDRHACFVMLLLKQRSASILVGSTSKVFDGQREGRLELHYAPDYDGYVAYEFRPSGKVYHFDVIVSERWGRQILTVLRWQAPDYVRAIGHAVMKNGMLIFQVDHERNYAMPVGSSFAHYDALKRPTIPATTSSKNATVVPSVEELEPELTTQDLARLRGELPMTPVVSYRKSRRSF